MGLFQFLPDNLIDEAPDHPSDAWTFLTGKALQAANENIISTTSNVSALRLRREVVEFSKGLAKSLKVDESLSIRVAALSSRDFDAAFNQLSVVHNRAIAERAGFRIGERIRRKGLPDNTVDEPLAISNQAVVKIHNHLRALRNALSASKLDERRQTELNALLDQFETLLNSKAPARYEFLKVLACLAATIGGSTAFLADAPEAMETIAEINAIVGEEIQSEEAANLIQIEGVKSVLAPPSEDAERDQDE